VADDVVGTIVMLAAAEVEGVAGIGSGSPLPVVAGARRGGKQAARSGVDITASDEGLWIRIRMQVHYGYRLTDVADQVRKAVADAVAAQVGAAVCSVDIYIDKVIFS
jgi:uncharacterized alkaline shock family protein YloU